MNGRFFCLGRADYVLVGTGTNGVKTECRKYIPGRHLSAIVVARQSVYFVFVHLPHNFVKAVFRLPRFVRPFVQIGYMMTWFISMYIVTHQALFVDIFGFFEIFGRKMHSEKRIKTANKLFLATHFIYQSVNIVRHKKGVIPRISFNKTLSMCIQQVKIFFK